MYSVVEFAGHQYKLQAGDSIDVDFQEQAQIGSVLELNKVLFVGGENPLVGQPLVQGALVKAKVVRHGKDRKVIIFKRKPGQYKKKNGHRQPYTALFITEVADGKGNVVKVDAASKKAQKYLK